MTMIITMGFTNNHACYQLAFNRVHQNFAEKITMLWLYTIFRHANLWLPSLSVYPWGGPTHQMCSQVPVLVSFDWLVLLASPSVDPPIE
jgi:hypothetical protein